MTNELSIDWLMQPQVELIGTTTRVCFKKQKFIELTFLH